jgi:mannose-6-phosphate isomerase-like protein (cupin superfamily)
MKIIKSKEFKPNEAWDSKLISNMNGITIKLHWTDEPYKWHINDGEEIFVVLDGKVKMFYKENEEEKSSILNIGDIFYASIGTKHYAHPIKEARILVIEKKEVYNYILLDFPLSKIPPHIIKLIPQNINKLGTSSPNKTPKNMENGTLEYPIVPAIPVFIFS